jgi:hypothetical protein
VPGDIDHLVADEHAIVEHHWRGLVDKTGALSETPASFDGAGTITSRQERMLGRRSRPEDRCSV